MASTVITSNKTILSAKFRKIPDFVRMGGCANGKDNDIFGNVMFYPRLCEVNAREVNILIKSHDDLKMNQVL